MGAQNRPIAFGIDDEALAPVGQRHIRKHTRQKRRRRIADPVVYFSRRRMQPAPMLAVVLEDELLVQPMQRVAIQDVGKPRLSPLVSEQQLVQHQVANVHQNLIRPVVAVVPHRPPSDSQRIKQGHILHKHQRTLDKSRS